MTIDPQRPHPSPSLGVLPAAPSGAAMDAPVQPRAAWWRWAALAFGVALLIFTVSAVVGWMDAAGHSGSTARVPAERVVVSRVAAGRFDDVIALRAVAAPRQSVVLDAQEGGQVERRHVEDGALVEAGQPIVQLANPGLRLDLLRSEAEVANQLNNLRLVEIQLQRQKAEGERLLGEVAWQLERARLKATREAELAQVGFVSPAAAQDGANEHRYWQERLAITRSANETDLQLQDRQARQLRSTAEGLQGNLALARRSLDALTVRAPASGRLTGFDVTLGQSLARGQRIGQVDSLDAGRLLAQVDEFYLARVALNQRAELTAGDPGTTGAAAGSVAATHPLAVSRINPQVKAGQFEVELSFTGPPPAGLRRGQTLQPRLTLGESRAALLLPIGAFATEGAASAVFVVNEAADTEPRTATRRAVTLGRRNTHSVEVLAGLQEGERVITSSTAAFAAKERLVLTR
jgi:HlyD family secretion protein